MYHLVHRSHAQPDMDRRQKKNPYSEGLINIRRTAHMKIVRGNNQRRPTLIRGSWDPRCVQ